MTRDQYEELEAWIRLGDIGYDQVAEEVARMWETIQRLRKFARAFERYATVDTPPVLSRAFDELEEEDLDAI